MLETINLKLKTPKEDYKQRWPILRDHLYDLQKACWEAGIPSIILFEGWDASGKGTTINALTQRLDPRGFKLYPIQAPRTQELQMPWLWRFWLKVPNYGEMAIFDRSWYGRVLVERVEQITPVEEWRTAFADIVNFERALIDDGYILIKFFLHISKKEQKKRFQKLESDPLESWHVQAEDWDHHRKYDKYLQSIEEMLERTETEWGPWTIVEATDKRWSRIKVIETIIQRLEAALRAKGLPIPIQPEAGVNADEPAENTDDLGDETQTPLFAISGQESLPVKRGRGRPRKNPLPEAVLSEGGEQAAAGEAQVKRGRGRPRKNPIESAEAVPAAEKKPRGRPRKNPIVNPPAALEGELIEEQQPEGEPQS
jgi:polyphosphate kinase 2 (PPK2 family)